MKFRNVHKEISRHGRTIYYYRAPNRPRIRLPDDYDSPAFAESVALAATLGIGRPPRRPDNSFVRNRAKIEKALASAIKGARQRARAKDLAFDLDLPWALDLVEAQQLRCALTGVPFYYPTNAKRNPLAPSLDRIKAGDDYTKNNVRIVCLAINIMLSDWGPEVLDKMILGYRAKRTKSKLLFPHPASLTPSPFKNNVRTKT